MANEKRLIDANALQLEPDPWGGMNGVLIAGRNGGKMMATIQAALRAMIENAPTVDAVEVVHGQWEDFCRGKMCCCSVCKAEFDNTCNEIHGEWYYCPNCGAKMDGERKDNEN